MKPEVTQATPVEPPTAVPKPPPPMRQKIRWWKLGLGNVPVTTATHMPSATIHQELPCSSAVAFALLHNYSRRLEWDTLLREAKLTRGHTAAAKGATSLCVGKPFFGLIGLETKYISFAPGKLAAVEMINRPPFFEHFAASIRHVDTANGSRATYKFHFTAKPRWFRWLLHPIMVLALRQETQKRLRALASFLQGPEWQNTPP